MHLDLPVFCSRDFWGGYNGTLKCSNVQVWWPDESTVGTRSNRSNMPMGHLQNGNIIHRLHRYIMIYWHSIDYISAKIMQRKWGFSAVRFDGWWWMIRAYILWRLLHRQKLATARKSDFWWYHGQIWARCWSISTFSTWACHDSFFFLASATCCMSHIRLPKLIQWAFEVFNLQLTFKARDVLCAVKLVPNEMSTKLDHSTLS